MKGLITALLLAAASPLAAATIAITGGTVHTATGAVIERGTVIVTDGRITAVGAGVAVPPGATVIDATAKHVTPGLMSALTTLGLIEVEGVRQTNDAAARNTPFAAAIDVVPALDPASRNIAINRTSGITAAVVAPGLAGDIFAGQGAVISLAEGGRLVERRQAFQFIALGEDGAQAAGGSRPAAWVQLTNALAEAARFARNPAGYASGTAKDDLVTRADAEALGPVLDGRQPLLVGVDRASDIVAVLGLKDRYPRLRLVLVSAREGWRVADRIAAAGVPVITQALTDLPDSFDTIASTRSNVGQLVRAGVTVALGTFGGAIGGDEPRNITQQAGNIVAQGRVPGGVGLSNEQALAAITAMPARIFGLADRGTLAPGQRGDVVVWDGDPLELTSAPVAVLIAGVPQPLDNRQTALRDRYRDLGRQDLPLAYPR